MTRQRRHVWVYSADGQHAGLVLTWRRTHDGSWEAQVAVNLSGTLLVLDPSQRPAARRRRPVGQQISPTVGMHAVLMFYH